MATEVRLKYARPDHSPPPPSLRSGESLDSHPACPVPQTRPHPRANTVLTRDDPEPFIRANPIPSRWGHRMPRRRLERSAKRRCLLALDVPVPAAEILARPYQRKPLVLRGSREAFRAPALSFLTVSADSNSRYFLLEPGYFLLKLLAKEGTIALQSLALRLSLPSGERQAFR
jgi:hypothetical protein